MGNTSIEQTSRSNTLVLEGLRNLKSASLFQIIAWILSLIAIVVFVVGWITAIIQSIKTFITFGAYPGGIFGGFIGLGLVVAELILSIIGITLSIISVFYLLSSVKKFVDWKPIDFSTPRKLLIGYLYGVIILLIGIVVAAVLLFTGIPSLALTMGVAFTVGGLIFLFVGWIGLIILFFRLKDVFNSSLFLIAGILVALFIAVIPQLVAWILVYVETSTLEKKIESGLIQL